MAKNNRLKRAVERQAKKTEPAGVNVTLREAVLLGVGKTDRHERPYVNLKYYYPDYECFSTWEIDELRAFSEFCRRIGRMRWGEIYRTGGNLGHKTGLGYTVHKDMKALPDSPDLVTLSPDLTWFELRVNQKCRVHGFRSGDAFFLVFLDRAHRIYPK